MPITVTISIVFADVVDGVAPISIDAVGSGTWEEFGQDAAEKMAGRICTVAAHAIRNDLGPGLKMLEYSEGNSPGALN